MKFQRTLTLSIDNRAKQNKLQLYKFHDIKILIVSTRYGSAIVGET